MAFFLVAGQFRAGVTVIGSPKAQTGKLSHEIAKRGLKN